MPTDKNKYGHLLYDESTLHRAGMIKFFQQVGFKLREIKEAKLAQIITEAKKYIKSL